jgi:hypothetical protein
MVVRGTVKIAAISATVFAGVVELLGQLDLLGGEFGFASAGAAAGAGRGQTFPGVGDDQVSLELGDRGEHAIHQPALAGGGVDALFEESERDSSGGELVEQGDQVAGGAPDPVEAGRDQNVAGVQSFAQCVPSWARGLRAGGVVEVELVGRHPRTDQRVALGVGILISGGHPAITLQHECRE